MGMFVIVNRFVNSTPSVPALRAALSSAPHARHYFDLAFLRDGLRFMPLNALGTRVRSHWLGMPFSDQRFAIRHAAFHSLGGFDESAPYGEDHLFVWRARRAGITVRATGSTLRTSARHRVRRGYHRRFAASARRAGDNVGGGAACRALREWPADVARR